jgi:hypothetical protein
MQIDAVGVRSDRWVDLRECRRPENARIAAAARELTGPATRLPAGKCTVRQLSVP